jgi:periplasmic protein TonB
MRSVLTIPSEGTQTILRWGACLVVVLGLHAAAVARLLEQTDFVDAPPGSEAVDLDLALGDLQDQIDPIQYSPPKPIEQDIKPQQEPDLKEAEVALPKEVEQPQTPTPVQPAPPQEEQEAKAPPKVSPDLVRKWQVNVSTRLNQFKRYPSAARTKHHEGKVVVAFTLDSGGRVVNSKIVKSSGSDLLDQETLDLIIRAQPYPMPPNGAAGQDLFLQVPISYAFR